MSTLITPPQSSSSNRPFLEFSPTFSDYYTESSPSADCSSMVVQMQLLRRLDSFRDKIAVVEPGSKNAKLLNVQLDAVEAALNAPDTQTREPTDLEDSGLFLSDEEEEQLRSQIEDGSFSVGPTINKKAWDILAQLKSQKEQENTELRIVIDRFESICLELEKRFDEVKHINDLTEHKLLRSTDEVARLKATNSSLQEENQSLREDLQLTGSELVFLKLQLNAIEQEVSSYLPQDGLDSAFEKAIMRWKLDWVDVSNRYTNRNNAETESLSASMPNLLGHSKATSEPNVGRPAMGHFSTASPSVKYPINPFAPSELSIPETSPKTAARLPRKPVNMPSYNQEPSQPSQPPQISRWAAFWDALADAAGVLDYNKLLHDDD